MTNFDGLTCSWTNFFKIGRTWLESINPSSSGLLLPSATKN